jgi:predicted ATPase
VLATGGSATDVPVAAREVIGRRLARLSHGCAILLDAAAVTGGTLVPDVLAEVTGLATAHVAELAAETIAAGILTSTDDNDGGVRFVHDLYRETAYARLMPARRLELHHRVATAILGRRQRGSPVFAAELAYHFTAASPATDTAAAVRRAQAAARADAERFAFAEAAGHLTRLRSAVANGGAHLDRTIRTGSTCRYEPPPTAMSSW